MSAIEVMFIAEIIGSNAESTLRYAVVAGDNIDYIERETAKRRIVLILKLAIYVTNFLEIVDCNSESRS